MNIKYNLYSRKFCALISFLLFVIFIAGCGAAKGGNVNQDIDTSTEVDSNYDILETIDGIINDQPTEQTEIDGTQECSPGQNRCGVDGIRETCSASGEWEDNPCSEEEACVGEGECLPIVCQRGEYRCNPEDLSQVQICDSTQTGWTLSVVCPTGTVCEDGVCVPMTCNPGDTICTGDGQIRTCLESGAGFGDPQNCDSGFVCDPSGTQCVPIICTPGSSICLDLTKKRICNIFGSGYETEDCPEGTSCSESSCLERICEPLSRECDPANPLAWRQCNATGTAWGTSTACPSGQGCSEGYCVAQICTPGSTTCAPGGLIRTCDDSGTFWGPATSCPSGQACDSGTCMPVICTPGNSSCLNQSTARVCNETGTGYIDEPCGSGYVCDTDRCKLQICIPGMTQCTGTTTRETCNALGTGWVPASSCTGRNVCRDGACLTPCQINELSPSSIGCIFYGVDLDQADELSADNSPYAIVIANTHDTYTASVTVQDRVGGSWRNRASATIAPNSLYTFRMSSDQHVEDTNKLNGYAYRVTSDLPIAAYQFNPIDTASQYSNDAALLLPKHTLSTNYNVAAWKHLYANGETTYRSYLTVVGAQDGTSVTVRVSAATVAGGGIPALSAGGTYTTTLNESDVLQIATSSANLDLTGSRVTSTAPVAVFGGSECADVPQDCSWCKTASGSTLPNWHGTAPNNWYSPYTCAWCDHVEEQMFPVTTWGRSYIAARVPVRSTGGLVEAGYWRVLASEDNTTVTITTLPGITLRFPSGVTPPYRINAGQYLEFEMTGSSSTPGDALVSADKPIMLVQYIEGQECTNVGAGSGGDPAEILMVPQEQYLSKYIFLTPDTYASDFVVVVKPTGSTVTLDGTAIPAGSFINVTSEWQVARPLVGDGVHTITGTAPFGIIGVGYSPYVSYGYMGGLALRTINP